MRLRKVILLSKSISPSDISLTTVFRVFVVLNLCRIVYEILILRQIAHLFFFNIKTNDVNVLANKFSSSQNQKQIILRFLINETELSKSQTTPTQCIQYQSPLYVLFQININVSIKSWKLLSNGRPNPGISKSNYIFCKSRLKKYGKSSFSLNFVARRDKFMLNNFQRMPNSIFWISKVVKILMARTGYLVINTSSKPFNTN